MTWRALAWSLALPFAVAPVALCASPARAYLDATRFTAPAVEGGAEGRFFTGAPADGYTCSVCHRGVAAPAIAIEGIPLEGWDPGVTYELALRLPADVRSAGATIEIADDLGAGHGSLDVVSDTELTDEDRCRTGERASVLVPLAGRIVARTEVCGAARIRVRWTAPATPVTDLRVFATSVRGDDSGDAGGDGAAELALPLRARGAPDVSSAMLGQRCDASPGSREAPWWWVIFVMAPLAAARRRSHVLASS